MEIIGEFLATFNGDILFLWAVAALLFAVLCFMATTRMFWFALMLVWCGMVLLAITFWSFRMIVGAF